MPNRISLCALISIFSLLLLNSLPFVQSIYSFSNTQQSDIGSRMSKFAKQFREDFHTMYIAKEKEHSASSSPTTIGQKVVTWADFKWHKIVLPDLGYHYLSVKNFNMQELIAEFETYNNELKMGQENVARQKLDDITEKLNIFRVGMSQWVAGDLEEKWRRSMEIDEAKKKRGSRSPSRHTEEEQPESSSSRNIENEEKIDVHFLPVKINEKIYELNEQIWFQNYNEFFQILKWEMEKDGVDILKLYQNTLKAKRNKIIQKELDKKIFGILPKFWKKDAEKAFNKKIEKIVENVRKKIDKKSFNKILKDMDKFSSKKQELIADANNFLREFSDWLDGKNKIVDKNKLAKLEAEVVEQIYQNETETYIDSEEKQQLWNVSEVKDIRNDAIKMELTELGRLTAFARKVVNDIESEISNKYEDEAIKKEIKTIYYTVLTNRATLEMFNYMADEFEFVLIENNGPQRNDGMVAHQQQFPEQSEIQEEEIQTIRIERKRKFVIENLSKISILSMDFLKNYLDKLNAKVLTNKFDMAKFEAKSKLRSKKRKGKGEPSPSSPVGETYKMPEGNKENPLVQSIKSLWPSTKNSNNDFNMFEFGMKENELPENFLDRDETRQQGWKTEVRVIVDSMNMLAIFSRMKHLMEKTGMDKSVHQFHRRHGKEVTEKLRAKIENIDDHQIPRTFAAFIYDKYVESLQPKPNSGSSRGDGQHSEIPGSEHSNSGQPTQTHSILQRTPTSSPHRSPRIMETSASPHQSPTSVFHTPHWGSPSGMGQHEEEEEEKEEDDDKQKETSIFGQSWGTIN